MIIFTEVSLIVASKKPVSFLVGGEVNSLDDIRKNKKGTEQMSKLPYNTEVTVQAVLYGYGEGEEYSALPDELAFFTKRRKESADFLGVEALRLGTNIFQAKTTERSE